MPKRRRFNRTLSRQLDATHHAIATLRQLPVTTTRNKRLAALTARLRYLESKIPVA